MHTGLSAGSLFLEGLLSFFSPCVLPLVPLYIGYLTKDTKEIREDGTVVYSRKKTFLFTIFFILGVSVIYVLAGLGSGFLRDLLLDHAIAFEIAGGFLLILLGLVTTGILKIPFLEQTWKKNPKLDGRMSPFKAWLLGFFFSFAWTPCTGPMLAQAIVMAANSENKTEGWICIASFAAGFIVIFLLLGIFTEEVLNLLKKYRGVVKYTGVIAGILVILSGGYMLYQGFTQLNAVTSGRQENVQPEQTETAEETEDEETVSVSKLDFTLFDIDGNAVSLSGLKGKTVILNFFGTWCYYCNEEMPSLQKIHETDPDVKVLLVAAPGVNGEGDPAYVEKYMKDAGYSMQIVYDTDLSVTSMYGISGYPTSYIIRPDGTFLGYVPGYVSEEDMLSYIEAAKE